MKLHLSIITFLLFGLLKFSAQCNTVAFIHENFDGWKGIPSCWETKSGLSMVYAKNNRITFYSLMTPKEDMYLVTPKLKPGLYTVSFDVTENGGAGSLQLFALENVSDKSTYISISKTTDQLGGKKNYTVKLSKSMKMGIKISLTEMHQAVYVDNISIRKK